jgi:hypothetical protein
MKGSSGRVLLVLNIIRGDALYLVIQQKLAGWGITQQDPSAYSRTFRLRSD